MNFSLTESQHHIQHRARDFAQTRVAPLAREMDERGAMPMELVREMGALGFLGGPLPNEYGGEDWDAVALALCYEELGRVDSSVRGLMTVHTSLVSQCILRWGTEEQKKKFLPKLARGEWLGCYALTEPNAGSDAASMETTATPAGDEFILNGEKIWITNGNIADVAIVFANSNRALKHKGICAFLLETNVNGFTRAKMRGQELGDRKSVV